MPQPAKKMVPSHTPKDVGGFVTACHISPFLACTSNGEIFDLRFQAHSKFKGGFQAIRIDRPDIHHIQ